MILYISVIYIETLSACLFLAARKLIPCQTEKTICNQVFKSNAH